MVRLLSLILLGYIQLDFLEAVRIQSIAYSRVGDDGGDADEYTGPDAGGEPEAEPRSPARDWDAYKAARGDQDCGIDERQNWFGLSQCQYSWECQGARVCEAGNYEQPNGWCSGDSYCPQMGPLDKVDNETGEILWNRGSARNWEGVFNDTASGPLKAPKSLAIHGFEEGAYNYQAHDSKPSGAAGGNESSGDADAPAAAPDAGSSGDPDDGAPVAKQDTDPQAESAVAGIDGGGWQLVRHVPAGSTWHPAKDALAGTDAYGNPAKQDKPWSLRFAERDFNQFLFATGDLEKWMIVSKDELLGSHYANEDKAIVLSSVSPDHQTEAKWYNRRGYPEDPWVSLTDHTGAIDAGDILYGEASYAGPHADRVLPDHEGANVFIRSAAHPTAGHARSGSDKLLLFGEGAPDGGYWFADVTIGGTPVASLHVFTNGELFAEGTDAWNGQWHYRGPNQVVLTVAGQPGELTLTFDATGAIKPGTQVGAVSSATGSVFTVTFQDQRSEQSYETQMNMKEFRLM